MKFSRNHLIVIMILIILALLWNRTSSGYGYGIDGLTVPPGPRCMNPDGCPAFGSPDLETN